MTAVAILGFGTVGGGVYELLGQNRELIRQNSGVGLRVKYICDIRDFSAHPQAQLFVRSIDQILADAEVRVVVETIGGTGVAKDFVTRALSAGKSVVTSNKELVAKHGTALLALAKKNGACFLFEASVGGGTPVITPMYRCLAPGRIDEIKGIVNGTTNFMLTKMEQEGLGFAQALVQAQRLGYAETADPSADVDGHDAARKIAILASIARRKAVRPESIPTVGIRSVTPEDMQAASRLGGVVKLMAWAKNGETFSAGVEPVIVEKGGFMAATTDVYNTIEVHSNTLGPAVFFARGAGSLPTANAVVADILAAVTEGAKIHDSLFWDEDEATGGPYRDEGVYDFYVRMNGAAPLPTGAQAVGEKAFRVNRQTRCQLEALLQALAQEGFSAEMVMKIGI